MPGPRKLQLAGHHHFKVFVVVSGVVDGVSKGQGLLGERIEHGHIWLN